MLRDECRGKVQGTRLKIQAKAQGSRHRKEPIFKNQVRTNNQGAKKDQGQGSRVIFNIQ